MDFTYKDSVILFKKEIPRFYRHTIYVKRKLKKLGAGDNMLAAFDVERKKIFLDVKRFIIEEYIRQRRPFDIHYSNTITNYKIRLNKIFKKYSEELLQEVE